MSDHAELVARLRDYERRHNEQDRRQAATAIEALVKEVDDLHEGLTAAYLLGAKDYKVRAEKAEADYRGQGDVLVKEVNAKLDAQLRAEKAEVDLAAARAALMYFADSLSEFHGGEHHDDECPDCRAMIEHAPAIAAARVEGGE